MPNPTPKRTLPGHTTPTLTSRTHFLFSFKSFALGLSNEIHHIAEPSSWRPWHLQINHRSLFSSRGRRLQLQPGPIAKPRSFAIGPHRTRGRLCRSLLIQVRGKNGQKCAKPRVLTMPLDSYTGGHGASKSSGDPKTVDYSPGKRTEMREITTDQSNYSCCTYSAYSAQSGIRSSSHGAPGWWSIQGEWWARIDARWGCWRRWIRGARDLPASCGALVLLDVVGGRESASRLRNGAFALVNARILAFSFQAGRG